MKLDEAYKLAVKKYYEGAEYKNVEKYSKKPFKFGFNDLDEIQKQFEKKKVKES